MNPKFEEDPSSDEENNEGYQFKRDIEQNINWDSQSQFSQNSQSSEEHKNEIRDLPDKFIKINIQEYSISPEESLNMPK
jgi:hypothetical protein